jgi:hypothetical protein
LRRGLGLLLQAWLAMTLVLLIPCSRLAGVVLVAPATMALLLARAILTGLGSLTLRGWGLGLLCLPRLLRTLLLPGLDGLAWHGRLLRLGHEPQTGRLLGGGLLVGGRLGAFSGVIAAAPVLAASAPASTLLLYLPGRTLAHHGLERRRRRRRG